ncbi:amidase [Solicola gregarius]|uniref:Amidase n=1 Tax=Solicola gregarius TaxID=2908642 RepID=A0AA46TL38_9ACTN|nr:amidase [Solicola gregarius]UYM07276.1 amidase [Solicola gregarius]
MTETLVPGDELEAATRAQYAAWMQHGVEASAKLGSDHEPAWPELASSGVGPAPAPSTYASATPEDVRQAADEGWLVTPPAPEADALDGPLHGLSVAVKDIIDVAGLPTHNGTTGGRWREPTASAPAWTALADAGAHCIGKAATHEMAWGVVTPQIANPFAPDRIAGGSSGGSAACVAAGSATGALGTDTGGSIRVPAALCGVVGFRPTTGAVPLDGVTGLAPEQDALGPLAADVTTCLAMLEVLLGRSLRSDVGDMAGVRIGVLERVGRLDPTVADAYHVALGALEAAGATVVECETSLHRSAAGNSLLTMLRSSALEHAEAVRAAPAAFGSEARALLTLGEPLAPYGELIDAARRAIAAETAALFTTRRLDAFLTPTTPCVAPVRGADQVEIDGRSEPVSAALVRYTGWAPVTAMPAVSVPVPPRTPRALPAGVQIMAPPHHDAVCARLAYALERRLRGG